MQNPHIQAGFFSLPCTVLHRIAFLVVSEWCQYYPRISLGLRTSFASTLEPPVQGHAQIYPGARPRSGAGVDAQVAVSRISAFSLMDRRPITSPDRCIAASGASVQSRLRVVPKYAGTIEVELRLVVDEEARSCKLSK